MSHDNSEANWNRRTDRPTKGQDHILSQADALTKNRIMKIQHRREVGTRSPYAVPMRQSMTDAKLDIHNG